MLIIVSYFSLGLVHRQDTVESNNGLLTMSDNLRAVASFSLSLSLYDIRAGAGGFRVRNMSIALLLPDDCRVSGAFRGCGGSE